MDAAGGQKSPGETINSAIELVWKSEAGRIIGGLTRIVRDLQLAEDLAQDALLAALEQWPDSGVPNNPGAWLMATAKHRAIDAIRRNVRFQQREQQLANDIMAQLERDEPIEPDEIADNLLRLIFTACHPVVPREGRVALTLRVVGGLTTEEIAHAFLVPVPTMSKRLARAKQSLAADGVPFEVPTTLDLAPRLSSVFEVVYLIFNEGYVATTGEEWMRIDLCAEALRLGRMLADLAPHQAEVHGLLALMELQASRSTARIGPAGEAILLPDQDRSRWDRGLIRRGLESLLRAEQVGGPYGPYTLQAAIAACHAQAETPRGTDWLRIVALYDALWQLTPSPLIQLNRAVALGMADGPAIGLQATDDLLSQPLIANYHLLPSVRGYFLGALGRHEEARAEFLRAAALAQNARERDLLLERAAASE